jgi:hypothetical protein
MAFRINLRENQLSIHENVSCTNKKIPPWYNNNMTLNMKEVTSYSWDQFSG